MLMNFFKKNTHFFTKHYFFLQNIQFCYTFVTSILPSKIYKCALNVYNMAGRCAVAISENACLLVVCWLKVSSRTVSKLSLSNVVLTFFAIAGHGLCLSICGLVIIGFIVDFKNTFFFFLYYISITVTFAMVYNFINRLSSIKIISNTPGRMGVNGCIIFTIFMAGFCGFSMLTSNIYAETLSAALQVGKIAKPVISSIVKGTALELVSPNIVYLDMSSQVHATALKTVFAKAHGILHLSQFSSLMASQTVNVLLELPPVQQVVLFNNEFIGYRDLCQGAHPTSPKPEIIDHYLIKSPPMEGAKAIIVSNKGHLYAGKSGLRVDNYSLIEDLSKPKLLFGEDRLMAWIKEIIEQTDIRDKKTHDLKKFLNMFPYSFSNLLDPEGTKYNPLDDSSLEIVLEKLKNARAAYINKVAISKTMMVYAGPDALNFDSNEMMAIIKKTGNDFNLFIKTPCLSRIK